MELNKTTVINFEELILLYKSYLDDTNNSVKNNLSKISSREKKPYQFNGILYDDKLGKNYTTYVTNRIIEYFISYKDIYNNNTVFIPYTKGTFSFDLANEDDSKKYGIIFGIEELYHYQNLKEGFSCEFVINGISFFARLDIITSSSFNSLNNTYATVKITNKNSSETEEFRYDYKERSLSKKLEDKNLIFPEEFKNQIINNLPSFYYKTLPKELLRYIKSKNWIIDIEPKTEIEDQKENQSFMNIICGNSINDVYSINNKESIKRILTKLKKSGIEFKHEQRIKISDSLFYIETTDTKKTIDPFFNDEDILKYCNLSKIDFTNADIKGFNLANTGASIILHKVFNKDITNANLENINLAFQDLAGIKADGANLLGTFVTVSIDKTSIIGTIFDYSCNFFVGGYRPNIKELASMGINILANISGTELKV